MLKQVDKLTNIRSNKYRGQFGEKLNSILGVTLTSSPIM